MTFEQGLKFVESYVCIDPSTRKVFDTKIKPELEHTNSLLADLDFTFRSSVIGTDCVFYWTLNFKIEGQAVMVEAIIDSKLTNVKYLAWFRHRKEQLRADSLEELLHQLGA